VVSPELLTLTLLRKIMLVFYASLGVYSIRFPQRYIASSGSVSVRARRYCINEHLPVRLTMMLGSDGDWRLQPLLTKCLA